MSSNSNAATAVYGRWKVMASNLQLQLDKFPQLTQRYTDLVKMTTDADALETRQAQLMGELQDLNQQRRELRKNGEDLRQRIGAVLRAEHGFSSDQLLVFGLKPRRPRNSAKKSPKEGTTTPPAPATTTPATKPA
ncbi:MAG TPA: hypothetical protein VLX28_12500 [Thermoanaerobaculia bacterium]|nr:hypothetical protein [Thermoanaerobaculia bacterium]